MPEFTDLEKALIYRALNTERNLLARLYGHDHLSGKPVDGYREGVVFNPIFHFQEQIDAINSAIEKIYP